MKIYEEITKTEVTSPDLEAGHLYDRTAVPAV